MPGLEKEVILASSQRANSTITTVSVYPFTHKTHKRMRQVLATSPMVVKSQSGNGTIGKSQHEIKIDDNTQTPNHMAEEKVPRQTL